MGFQKPVTAEAAPKKKASAKTRPELVIDGTEKLASLAALIEALQTRYTALDATVRGEATAQITLEGAESGLKPANPIISEGIGSANFQIKSRSAASALTDEVYEALKAAGIPVKEIVTTPSYLAVNPKYANDQEKLALADKYLTGQDGIPEDFIIETAETKKKVVGENAIEAVFAKKDVDFITANLPHVATFAIAQIKVSDVTRALEVVAPELQVLYPTFQIDLTKIAA